MILFAGDPHGRFKPIVDAARMLRPAGVVLLGDHDLDVPSASICNVLLQKPRSAV